MIPETWLDEYDSADATFDDTYERDEVERWRAENQHSPGFLNEC